MQLVAASTPGRSWDIALTSGDPYFDENHFIRVEPGQSIAYLQRYARNGQGYETIADVTVLGNWVYGGPDDAYEENDSRAEAYDLSDHQATWLSNLDGPGIQADQDWYEIFVPAGQERVFVDCRFDHLMGDIDIGLYDSAGNLLDGSYSFSDDEYIDYVVPGSGAYFVRVAYSDWGNEYDLWWDVQGPPDPPVANDDAATLAEDSGPFAVDVLANDVDSSDPSEPLAVVSAWGAEHGFVQVANGGSSVSYRPYADFNGFDSFTYTIMQNGQTDTATVFVEVTPVNDAPTAWGQDVATDMDQSVDIPLAADDPETPYSDLVFDITQPPAHGTLTEIGPGQYSYEPDAGYIGPDSFTYTVTDDGDPAGSGEGAADSGPAVVNVQVGRRVDLDARGQVTFEDSNGNLVTVRLRGEGTGYLLFAHDGPCDVGRIVLNGTNEDSSLFITIRGRGAETTVVDILVNGSLQNLQGSCVNLLGDVTVTGSLAKLVLADVADQHVITIGPRPVDDITTTLTMQFRRVEDTSVFSQTPLGIVTAIDWQDNDETRDVIEAASLDMLRIQGRRARPWQDVPAVAGDFGADLILQTLGTARIAADMVDCLWEIAGGMGNLTVNGTARDNTVRTAGSMGNLVFGAVENSDFLAGCAEGVGRHAEAREDFVNLLAGINLVRIRGFRMPWGAPRPRLVTNSNFSAATFGNVRLMNVDYDNGGDAFGLFACDLGPGREIQSVRHRDTEDASQNWNWPPAGGEVFDHPDLAIEII
ncbi:MAG: Ig-like domain-containing protein [Planctomycetota bacterium]|nr:Ig-like domain-containing protein [Planctomycetota bacterium]